MRSTVTSRGQTVIPAEIRRRLGITPQTKLEWRVEGNVIVVRPIPKDPIGALEGCLKGSGITRSLLEGRREERAFEEERDGAET
jgi:AbrB family looped-hinge helix DNA binding protein